MLMTLKYDSCSSMVQLSPYKVILNSYLLNNWQYKYYSGQNLVLQQCRQKQAAKSQNYGISIAESIAIWYIIDR